MKRVAFAALSVGAILIGPVTANAAIVAATYDPTGHHVIDFEDAAATPFPGTVYDGILVSGGANFAERFVGQTLGSSGDNDTLSGSPTGPLTLLTGAPNQNLDLGTDNGTHNLIPCGPLGCTSGNGYGEGAFAVLFPTLTSYFGFQQFFSDSSGALTTLDFFDSAGASLGEVTVSTTGDFAFSSTSGRNIAGVSVFTADAGGLAYDNLLSDLSTTTHNAVPEPSVWTLMIGGLGLAGAMMRRRSVRPAA